MGEGRSPRSTSFCKFLLNSLQGSRESNGREEKKAMKMSLSLQKRSLKRKSMCAFVLHSYLHGSRVGRSQMSRRRNGRKKIRKKEGKKGGKKEKTDKRVVGVGG